MTEPGGSRPSSPGVRRGRRPFREVVGGFLIISVATFGTQLIGFVALAITARRVGPAHLGAYTFAYGIATYLMLPVNMGLGAIALRDAAEDEGSTLQVMAEVAVLQAVVTVVSYAVLLAVAALVIPGHEAGRLLPIAGLTIVVQTITFDWVVQARQSYSLLAAARLLGQVVFGVLVIAFVTGGHHGIWWYAWANLIGVVVTAAAIASALFRVGLPRRSIVLSRLRLVGRLRGSLSMGVVLTLNQIYYSVDSTILGALRSTTEVGRYGVAYKIPLALIAFVNVWNNTLYAHASGLVREDPEQVRRQIGFAMTVALMLGLPLVLGAAFLGRPLLSALFGSSYGPAGPAFALLVGSTIVYMVWVNLQAVSVAAGRQRDYTVAVLYGTVFNVVANLVVIPHFGLVGAATVTVVTEMIITVYLWRTTRRLIGSPTLDLARLGRAAVAAAGMAALLAVSGGWEVFIRLVLAAACFAVLAAALRVVGIAELRSMRGRPSGT